MTIAEAQEAVDQWIKTIGVRYFSELTNMACLTEEVGELARVIARKYGDQSFKKGEEYNLAEEMADVLWVLICLANQTGVNLTEALQKSIEKKNRRNGRTNTFLRYKNMDKNYKSYIGKEGYIYIHDYHKYNSSNYVNDISFIYEICN